MTRPSPGELLTLAYAGKLPSLLTPAEVLALWLPRIAGEDRTVAAKRRAIEGLMRDAMASKALPSIKLPDTTTTVQAPVGGYHAGWRSRIKSLDFDERTELRAKTAPWERPALGLVFVRDSDVQQFVALAPAQLQPAKDAPLSLWLTIVGRPKSCVDSVNELVAAGVSKRKAYAQVAPLFNMKPSGVSTACNRHWKWERDQAAAKVGEQLQRPVSTAVSKGRFH